MWVIFHFNYIRYSRYNLQSFAAIIKNAENKKTVLYILARENATQEEFESLDYWYAIENQNKDKIQAVEQIFRRTKADERALLLIHKHTDIAKNHLDQIKVDDEKKKPLIELAHFLLKRES